MVDWYNDQHMCLLIITKEILPGKTYKSATIY